MIRNYETLTRQGSLTLRKDALDIATHALEALHPSHLLPAHVTRHEAGIAVDGTNYPLTEDTGVFVIGAGKGSLETVRALVELLDDAVTDGVVVEKVGQGGACPGVEVHEAGHPLPDSAGLQASDRVLDLADRADEDDLVFVCITGGASALLPAPVDPLTLDDLRMTTEVLLDAGLPIEEINAVRRHVSSLKGGQLTERIAPASTISLIVVDEVAGEPWGPTVPDRTTAADAVAVLNDRALWDEVPSAVRDHLTDATRTGSDTPRDDELAEIEGRRQTVVLADGEDACTLSRQRAEELGYETMILSTTIEGESREVGTVLAGIASEIQRRSRPIEPPCVIISGGETTVEVEGASGTGGPNQELALSFASRVRAGRDVVLLSLGTDGTDGPTAVAGGIVDGTTADRAEQRGIDLIQHLRQHDSTPALRQLDDAIVTGATGTNVMDLRLLLVDG